MKELLFKLSLLSPILCIIVLFNIIVDPAMIFKNKGYEKKIVEALVSGHAVTDLEYTNFDDRFFEKLLIQSLARKMDIGVWGSSRVMLISSEVFPGNTLINNGLSFISLEDFISLYEIYKEKQVLPRTLIIGVDPWMFDSVNKQVEWKRFGQEYCLKFNSMGENRFNEIKFRPQEIIPFEFQELISLSYFQAGIKCLLEKKAYFLHKAHWFSIASSNYNEKDTILPDGARTWARNLRQASKDELDQELQAYTMQEQKKGLLHFDQERKKKFLRLVESLKKDGVNVVLFLAPIHPIAYDFYKKTDFEYLTQVESLIKETSKAYGVTLIGAYDARQLFVPDSSFYDAVHLKDDTQLKRIFASLSISKGIANDI